MKNKSAPCELTAFHGLNGNKDFVFISSLLLDSNHMENVEDEEFETVRNAYCNIASAIIDWGEAAGLSGNLWHLWLARCFVVGETTFALAHERITEIKGSAAELAMHDASLLFDIFYGNFSRVENMLDLGSTFRRLTAYCSAKSTSGEAAKRILQLTDNLEEATSKNNFLRVLSDFYAQYGCGIFALNRAFRWDGEEEKFLPVTNTEDIILSDLIGYEDEKRELVENTVAFLNGRPANNVLLYGESGTGKSSSIKALLNEYECRGLRMIEVYKNQIGDLDKIVDMIKGRGYKFILFMDDLSFEQFETEYKYLKAFIEGGLEKRPDNILIYATSNRRHLMKETWSDRDDKDDDMHESETMQERMSLVDRFGLMIRYMSPEQKEYLRIVKELAASYGVDVPDAELEHGAVRWELKHGGFSGRSARQYVEHLAGAKK